MPYRPSPEKVKRNRAFLESVRDAVVDQEPLFISVGAETKGAVYSRLRDILNAARQHPQTEYDEHLADAVKVSTTKEREYIVLTPKAEAQFSIKPREEVIKKIEDELREELLADGWTPEPEDDA